MGWVSRLQHVRLSSAKEESLWLLNQYVPTVFDCIEGAHALDERCRWHPNPAVTRSDSRPEQGTNRIRRRMRQAVKYAHRPSGLLHRAYTRRLRNCLDA
jgi:hypothetical protein